MKRVMEYWQILLIIAVLFALIPWELVFHK
jgi:hypothetical protein